jgi:hypothetical protein
MRAVCRAGVKGGKNGGKSQPVMRAVCRAGGNLTERGGAKELRKKSFSFDKVFGPTASQQDVFVELQPIVTSCLDGYNVCIFAYGQVRCTCCRFQAASHRSHSSDTLDSLVLCWCQACGTIMIQ